MKGIDYNSKWKMNVVISVAYKITVIQFITDVRPTELVTVIGKADLLMVKSSVEGNGSRQG